MKFAVMTNMVLARTSLRLWKRFCSGFKPDHRLITGLFNTHWSVPFFFFSTFAFSIVGATTTGSLAFTNFTSLEIFIAELLSLVCPNPVLSEKVF